MKTNKKGIFISDTVCISAQNTADQTFFSENPIVHHGNRYAAKEPAYGNLIPAGLLRRMGKAVRMGVGAGLPLMQRNSGIGGIILGTANGGLEDCLKFLNQIVDYNEGTLTPTNFVQSTPNAVAGSLALMSKNTGYNITHVHKGLAFEAAVLDAILLLQENEVTSILLGGVEEISDYNYNIDFLGGSFKKEEVTSENLLTSGTPGTVSGEGAALFVVTAELQKNSLAELVDVDQISYCDQHLLEEKLQRFLVSNNLTHAEIDTLILGYSGDARNDHWFTNLQNLLFPESSVFVYKNMVGDYPTSPSFAVWLAVQILTGKNIPAQMKMKDGNQPAAENILIYNHYKGVQHGFILMRKI